MNSALKLPQKAEKRRGGVYFDKDLYDEIEYIADANGMSFNSVVEQLVETGLDRLKKEQQPDQTQTR